MCVCVCVCVCVQIVWPKSDKLKVVTSRDQHQNLHMLKVTPEGVKFYSFDKCMQLLERSHGRNTQHFPQI
jgi:hypothetical protein